MQNQLLEYWNTWDNGLIAEKAFIIKEESE